MHHLIDHRAVDANGVTDLMRWCYEGVPGAVKHLLEMGANVEAQDTQGHTPIFYVVFGNAEPEVLRLILSAGANPNACNEDGETPLMRVAANRPCKNRVLLAMTLIKAGADVNARTHDDGYSVLMLAARWLTEADEIFEFLDVLLAAGADPHVLSAKGKNLSQVADRGRSSIARHLWSLQRRPTAVTSLIEDCRSI